LGIGPNPQSPIPNPQSPIPNPQDKRMIIAILLNKNKLCININILGIFKLKVNIFITQNQYK